MRSSTQCQRASIGKGPQVLRGHLPTHRFRQWGTWFRPPRPAASTRLEDGQVRPVANFSQSFDFVLLLRSFTKCARNPPFLDFDGTRQEQEVGMSAIPAQDGQPAAVVVGGSICWEASGVL